MKKFTGSLALAAAFGIAAWAAPAMAGAGCGSSCGGAAATKVSKVASSGCSSSATAEISKVAMGETCPVSGQKAANYAKADCASACGASETVAMAKGGAADEVKAGYGIGHQVPSFTLEDTTGATHTLDDRKGNVTVLVFYNQDCPYVVEVNDRLNDFTKTYAEKGVGVWAIDAGINNSPEKIGSYAENQSYPILLNRTSDLARKFEATRTPEVFVLDRDNVVRYHGAFDNGQAGSAEGARRSYAKDAVDAILNNEDIIVQQTKAFGCSIKFNPNTTADAGAADSETSS